MTRFASLSLCLLAVGCIGVVSPGASVPLASRIMSYDGRNYPFVVYVPTSYHADAALPSLLLVHGAGGNGIEFIQSWTTVAEREGIILVAPTLDLSAEAETRVPAVFPRLMDAVTKEWNVDSTRRYLFGYSAGGYFVYDAALLNADYFAGAGIFASVIQPDYDSIVVRAPRKTDIAIYLGDQDPYFTLDQGRRTRDLLAANGMNVHYVELAGQGHDYSTVSAFVNDDAWRFLRMSTLAPKARMKRGLSAVIR